MDMNNTTMLSLQDHYTYRADHYPLILEFGFLFVLYLLIFSIAYCTPGVRQQPTRSTNRSLNNSCIIDSRRGHTRLAIIPHTNYLAAFDGDIIRCAKRVIIASCPLFRRLDTTAQDLIISRIIEDLTNYLDGSPIANCPYQAYQIAANTMQYLLEKDFFDATRYSGTGNIDQKIMVVPPFSFFIALVYKLVTGDGYTEAISVHFEGDVLELASSVVLESAVPEPPLPVRGCRVRHEGHLRR